MVIAEGAVDKVPGINLFGVEVVVAVSAAVVLVVVVVVVVAVAVVDDAAGASEVVAFEFGFFLNFDFMVLLYSLMLITSLISFEA